jgi:hypothetical protein
MSAGTDIASEVAAALGEAAAATGNGPLIGIIRRRGAATGPAYEPTYGPDTEHRCNVVLDTFTAREREGTSIAATDTKIMVSTLDIEPTAADTIEVDGTVYEIVDAMPLNPGGVVLMWILQART